MSCLYLCLEVTEVDTQKLLGVTFDRRLHFGQNLHNTALRAAQRNGFLGKAFKMLDHIGRTAAYKGFVQPMLEYSTLVWSGAADGHLRRLDKVPKRALLLIRRTCPVFHLESFDGVSEESLPIYTLTHSRQGSCRPSGSAFYALSHSLSKCWHAFCHARG